MVREKKQYRTSNFLNTNSLTNITEYGDIIVAMVAPVTASEEPQINLVTGGIFLISERISMWKE